MFVSIYTDQRLHDVLFHLLECRQQISTPWSSQYPETQTKWSLTSHRTVQHKNKDSCSEQKQDVSTNTRGIVGTSWNKMLRFRNKIGSRPPRRTLGSTPTNPPALWVLILKHNFFGSSLFSIFLLTGSAMKSMVGNKTDPAVTSRSNRARDLREDTRIKVHVCSESASCPESVVPTCSLWLWEAWWRETTSRSASSGRAARLCGCVERREGRRHIRQKPPAANPRRFSLCTNT